MKISLSRNRIAISSENVEKVVKPPHRPVPQVSRVLRFLLLAKSIPRAAQPKRLINSVGHGKIWVVVFSMTNQRRPAPRDPPIPTLKKSYLPICKHYILIFVVVDYFD